MLRWRKSRCYDLSPSININTLGICVLVLFSIFYAAGYSWSILFVWHRERHARWHYDMIATWTGHDDVDELLAVVVGDSRRSVRSLSTTRRQYITTTTSRRSRPPSWSSFGHRFISQCYFWPSRRLIFYVQDAHLPIRTTIDINELIIQTFGIVMRSSLPQVVSK